MPPLKMPPEGDADAPVEGVVPVELMAGDDEEDTKLLRVMSSEAEAYIHSFSWCGEISSVYFGGGVGGIFAIFLFKIRPTRPEFGSWMWIVVGDIPPAYLPLEDGKSPKEVFETYMWGMNKWVQLAREGRVGTADDNVPPMDVPATPEWAAKLEQKLQLLTLLVKPFFDGAEGSSQVN
jgi:hypothetical protein